MTDQDIIDDAMTRSDKMANTIAAAMNAMPEQEHSYSVAVLTFLRMGSYAALCLGMSRRQFEQSAGEIFARSKAALEQDDIVPTVKH